VSSNCAPAKHALHPATNGYGRTDCGPRGTAEALDALASWRRAGTNTDSLLSSDIVMSMILFRPKPLGRDHQATPLTQSP